MKADIRKIAVWVEETHREMGRDIAPATRKPVAVAVIANPFAGRYVEDLTDLMDIGAELGGL
ncbi:MAG: amino acid synthesis family protein, partial [Rhodobacteraceae bacterium]|nr:amino acid synthesis family protein [Paracoccaceae bacterium]